MRLYLFIIMFSIALFSYANAALQTDTTKTDSTQIDTLQEVPPDFTGVDVIVETEWGEPEKTENVDVFLHLKDKQPHIIMSADKHKQCEVRIFKGITVKIVDHKTGKLLKTYRHEG